MSEIVQYVLVPFMIGACVGALAMIVSELFFAESFSGRLLAGVAGIVVSIVLVTVVL
jgi:hypothetical protein